MLNPTILWCLNCLAPHLTKQHTSENHCCRSRISNYGILHFLKCIFDVRSPECESSVTGPRKIGYCLPLFTDAFTRSLSFAHFHFSCCISFILWPLSPTYNFCT